MGFKGSRTSIPRAVAKRRVTSDDVSDQQLLESVPATLTRPPYGPSKLLTLAPELLDMIAFYLDLKNLQMLRRVCTHTAQHLIYMLADRCPRHRSYRSVARGLTRLATCQSLLLWKTISQLSFHATQPSLMIPACVKHLNLPNLQSLDLQAVRFAVPENFIRLLRSHRSSLRRLRLCFVDLQRFEWWREVLLILRDDLSNLEDLTVVALRYSHSPFSDQWYVLGASEPLRCKSCSEKVWHRRVIDLHRHPATNCEHTRSFSGKASIRVGLGAFFDANDKLARFPETLLGTSGAWK